MKRGKTLFTTVAMAAAITAGAAYGGPAVQVTVKHLGASGSAPAVYTITNANETSTYQNSRPKPDQEISGGNTGFYTVQSLISPDTNFATVRYKIGDKTCVFSTTFLNIRSATGSKTPQWKKSATPSGGASCTATITSTNYTDYSWAVQFTMK
ncbi:hypothetical protein DCO48_08515 [Pseudomonas sp. SDI]|uniref:hypothetical protein n=1 Tax=Pseudomonas sp. SDI TaxID=2170734 RepID=UPI000DE74907|nr:hypothetical protein [Pseudomonas sp. SDI]PWB33691.1 hypothetical protein DCO48_08515 [Pseudomonas sp. SDI]